MIDFFYLFIKSTVYLHNEFFWHLRNLRQVIPAEAVLFRLLPRIIKIKHCRARFCYSFCMRNFASGMAANGGSGSVLKCFVFLNMRERKKKTHLQMQICLKSFIHFIHVIIRCVIASFARFLCKGQLRFEIFHTTKPMILRIWIWISSTATDSRSL